MHALVVARIWRSEVRATQNSAPKPRPWVPRRVSGAAFGALLLLLLAEAAAVCPAGCSCSPGGEAVSCVGLRDIPRSLGASLRSLHITNHRITHLSDGAFAGLDGLQDLKLAGGRLSEVSHEAFSSLKEMRSLNLSDNELNVIERDVFSECPKLQYLVLSRNPLALPARGPILESRSLAALDLSRCSLSQLPAGAFSATPALRELRLRGNDGLASMPQCALGRGRRLTLLDADPGFQVTEDCPDGEEARGHRAGGEGLLSGELLRFRNIAYVSIICTCVLAGVAAGLCLAVAWNRRHRSPSKAALVEKNGYVFVGHSHASSLTLPTPNDFHVNRQPPPFLTPNVDGYEYIAESFYDNNSQYSTRFSQSDVPLVHHNPH